MNRKIILILALILAASFASIGMTVYVLNYRKAIMEFQSSPALPKFDIFDVAYTTDNLYRDWGGDYYISFKIQNWGDVDATHVKIEINLTTRKGYSWEDAPLTSTVETERITSLGVREIREITAKIEGEGWSMFKIVFTINCDEGVSHNTTFYPKD